MNKQMERALGTRITDRELSILAYRFGLDNDEPPQTLKEVAKQMQVTPERIRQIELRALRKLWRSPKPSPRFPD